MSRQEKQQIQNMPEIKTDTKPPQPQNMVETKIDAKPPQPVIPDAVAKAVLDGKIVFYGEYRKGVAVEFPGKGGKLYHQSKEVVETSTGVITVTEFLPDSLDWTQWKPSIQKGQMVYGVCRSLEEASGAQVAGAKLYPV